LSSIGAAPRYFYFWKKCSRLCLRVGASNARVFHHFGRTGNIPQSKWFGKKESIFGSPKPAQSGQNNGFKNGKGQIDNEKGHYKKPGIGMGQTAVNEQEEDGQNHFYKNGAEDERSIVVFIWRGG